MEQNFNYQKYSKFINVVQVIVKVIMIITAVFMGITLLGLLASLFIPTSTLVFDLSVLNNYDYRGINIINAINPAILDSTISVKRSLIAGLFTLNLHVFFSLFILVSVHKLLSNVKSEPFNTKNGIVLRNLSIGFFVASIVLSLFAEIFQYSVAQMIGFEDMKFNFHLNWQYVFMGVLILILGYIFQYGAYLQDEHDQTV